MSVFRIVKRNLLGNGVKHTGPTRPISDTPEKHRWFWNHGIKLISYTDTRPRDKYGILSGYCSKMEAERKRQNKSHVKI